MFSHPFTLCKRFTAMHTLCSLLSILAFAGASLVVPAQSANAAGFRGELHRKRQDPHGPAEWFRAMSKYNIDLRPHEKRALDDYLWRRQEGDIVSAVLTSSGASYQTPIIIGDQLFYLDLDTGSPDIWVYSSYTEDLPSNVTHNIYDPTNSTTAVPTNATFSIAYGDNSTAEGYVFLDTIDIGGLVVVNQAIGAAVNVTGSLTDNPSDGLLGLSPGPSAIEPAGVPTILENLAVNGSSPTNVFTCSLTRANEPPGFYTFGFVDPLLLGNSTPQFTPVNTSNGFWEFDSTFAIINGETIQRPAGNTAFADTGNTLILLGDDILPAIYEPVNGTYDPTVPGYVFPADTLVSQIPTIVLPAGSIEITISPEDFARFSVNDSFVFGSIQPRGDAPADVFGDVWLVNAYVIWDFGTTVEGFQLGAIQRLPDPS
jgi:hypothetical protein